MIRVKKQHWLFIAFTFIFLNFLSAASETKLLRQPDIHNDKIVFCYGGNLYTAVIIGKRGTQIKRLTDFPGEESWPKFSPDGRRIAFTAQFEGNIDVYVMSVSGGKPKRLTFHPQDDRVVDWHPDGKRILFRSIRSSYSYRFNRLHLVPVEGGLPEAIDLPEGELAGFNQSGNKIAFCRTSLESTPHWKRYRGGLAPNIWTYDFANRKAEPVISHPSINQFPMWMGNDIYFLSDRGKNKEQNLWVYRMDTKNVRQLTFHQNWEIKHAAIHHNQIVYERGGILYVYDTRNKRTRAINIKITLPKNHLAAKTKNVKDRLGSITISPDGKQVVFYAAGDLFLMAPGKKNTTNLTGTQGIKEKYPTWSPNGKYLAYISDATGEEQLYIRNMTGKNNTTRQITKCEKSSFGSPYWSPNSRKIGYSDHRSTFYIIDIETEETRKVFFNKFHGTSRFVSAAWSPDSKWLAFSNRNRSQIGSIYLYSLDTAKTHRVTGELTHDEYPQFGTNGDFLYWITGHEVNVEDTYWDSSHHMVNPSKIIAAALRKEIPAPFSPEQEVKAPLDSWKKMPLRIDIEGLGDRIVSLPVEKSKLRYLKVTKGKLIFYSEPFGKEAALKMFDLNEKKESVLLKNAWYCVPAANAGKMAYKSWNSLGVLDIKPGQKAGDGQLDFSRLNMTIDYKKTWKHIFDEAWRIQRDSFWDQDLNGVDWKAVKKRYDTLVPFVASRKDLNHLIERMFAELGHSHVEVSGGEMPDIKKEKNGILGIDLKWDTSNKKYRITKLYRGQNWNPKRISPLTLPGVNVKTGDFLLAIDGTELVKTINPYSLLVNKAGKPVSVTVHSSPTLKGARTIHVPPASLGRKDRNFLRYNEWVLGNIEKVNTASNGKIGYIHLPNTYYEGIEAFFRYFHPQLHKKALIVDIRYNGGGYSPYWMLERLNRKCSYTWPYPHGKGRLKEPEPGFFGPKVCIANEWAESGGEMFVDMFRLLKSGTIIGKRTAGSLSSTGGNRLIDGGVIIFPAGGPPIEQGNIRIENIGVSPDIEVTNRPDDLANGKDTQLERGIDELLKKLNRTR